MCSKQFQAQSDAKWNCARLDVMMMQCPVMVCISQTEDADKTCSRGLWYAMSTLSYPLWTTQTLTFVPKALWYTMSMLLPTVNNQDADISSTGLVVCYVNTSPTHCKQRKCWLPLQPTVNNENADICSKRLVVCYVSTPTHYEQPCCWHLFQTPCGRLCQYFSNPLWTTMLLTFVPNALW